jgi:hypothetical protein
MKHMGNSELKTETDGNLNTIRQQGLHFFNSVNFFVAVGVECCTICLYSQTKHNHG